MSGYHAVKLSRTSSKGISNTLRRYGLEYVIKTGDHHVTLMYDKSNPDVGPDSVPETLCKKLLSTHVARVTGVGKLGNAVVFHLDCESLHHRHKQLCEKGYTHSFSEFKPHMSVFYSDDPAELDKALEITKKAFDEGDLDVPLVFDSEYNTELT